MGQANEVRWLQRLDSFGAALARLDEACAKDSYTDLERAGLVYIFMLNYELSWKTLQALLTIRGFTANTPRDAIRRGFEAGYLNEEDCDALLRALDNRNRLSHIYRRDEARYAEDLIKGKLFEVLSRLQSTLDRIRIQETDGLKDRHRSAIHGVLSSNPRVKRAVLFGSRATGGYRPASDVDLALFGDSLTLRDQFDLAVAMEELTVPQRVDLHRHRDIVDSRVLEEIERHGVEWYTRSPHAEGIRECPPTET